MKTVVNFLVGFQTSFVADTTLYFQDFTRTSYLVECVSL